MPFWRWYRGGDRDVISGGVGCEGWGKFFENGRVRRRGGGWWQEDGRLTQSNREKGRTMASASVSQIVEKLNLKPHPEGGFFSETLRDTSVTLSKSHLPSTCKLTLSSLLSSGSRSGSRFFQVLSRINHFKVADHILICDLGLDHLTSTSYSNTFESRVKISFLFTTYGIFDKVDRPISTCIYFLLPSGSVSVLHRIPCAETWHFYMGEPLTVLEMNDKDGSIKLTCLGPNPIDSDQHLQYTVPPNVWFGAYPTQDINVSSENGAVKTAPRDAENHFSLVGCTCAPAFQFEDFEFARRSELSSLFPKYESLINLLTFAE
ncbi:hypothetical protein Acr_00g0057970 [Actinidia rufa]|uniref:DUF985 domain-containing protein n=1 Tax=Actinidia rufa TaxID=165716 RepID=A0A7J0DMX9_9ERIC|nr:hypothetical protein Acr_00g0057970 [Actinidia rufa]